MSFVTLLCFFIYSLVVCLSILLGDQSSNPFKQRMKLNLEKCWNYSILFQWVDLQSSFFAPVL